MHTDNRKPLALICCAVFVLFFCVMESLAAAETQTALRQPDEVIGTGAHEIRPVVLDPVTQKPWARKPYRLVIEGIQDKTIADNEGITDDKGRTLTIRSAEPISESQISIRPLIGSGGHKVFLIFKSHLGKPVPHTGYIMTVNGIAFLGMANQYGESAEVRIDKPGQANIVIVYLETVPDWQGVAAILNQTAETATPEKRVAIIEKAIAYSKQHGGKDAFAKERGYLEVLLNAELQNAVLAPALLPAVEQRLLAMKLAPDEGSSSSNAENAKQPDIVSASKRLSAMISILRTKQELGLRLDSSPLMQDAIALAQHVPEDERDWSLAESILFLSQTLVQEQRPDQAEQIILASEFDKNLSSDSAMLKLLVMQAGFALDKGHADEAEALFSVASFLAKSEQEESDDDKKDVLAKERARFPNIRPDTMVVTADALAYLRGQCIQYAKDLPLFFVGEAEDPLRTLNGVQSVMAIDALLTHGELKAGKYLTRGAVATKDSKDHNNTCESAIPRQVEVTGSDIKMVRRLSMMGPLLLPKDARADEFPPHVTAHLADVLAVFFEHAQLKPGRYERNKTLEKVDLHIGW